MKRKARARMRHDSEDSALIVLAKVYEDFKAFADYQLHICEKSGEMLGNSSHLLYICKKG